MNRDERFYAFIVSTTSRSRSYVRRVSIHKRWVKVSAVVATVLFCCAAYGVYGLTQQALHLRIEEENNRLRLENERQRRQLNNLKNRVEAIEDAMLADQRGEEDAMPGMLALRRELAGRRDHDLGLDAGDDVLLQPLESTVLPTAASPCPSSSSRTVAASSSDVR